MNIYYFCQDNVDLDNKNNPCCGSNIYHIGDIECDDYQCFFEEKRSDLSIFGCLYQYYNIYGFNQLFRKLQFR